MQLVKPKIKICEKIKIKTIKCCIANKSLADISGKKQR